MKAQKVKLFGIRKSPRVTIVHSDDELLKALRNSSFPIVRHPGYEVSQELRLALEAVLKDAVMMDLNSFNNK